MIKQYSRGQLFANFITLILWIDINSIDYLCHCDNNTINIIYRVQGY